MIAAAQGRQGVLRSLLLAHAPKLKAVTLDSGFDHLARELMGWVAIGRDGADRMPGGELPREPAAAQTVAERAQVGPCFRLEK